MSLRDRMRRAGPLWRAMASRLNSVIEAINELRSIVVVGQNPHKVNDTADTITVSLASSQDEAIDLVQQMITKYESHIGSSTYHLAADSTNVVTESGVPIEIYTLLNELKIDLNAHMSNATAHTNDDDVTAQVAGDDASSKATAIALANEIRASYEAHRVNLEDAVAGAVHGAADETDVVTVEALDLDATWEEIAALADDLRAQYEAHRVLTTASVHDSADSTNSVTATAIGTFATAVYAGINELKTDFNAHVAEFGTSHAVKDISSVVATANASSLATLIALANDLKAAINDHLTRGDSFTAIPSLSLDS
jgi:iron-sulfur cluster repair protein YtfE (RIC family)